MKHTISAVVGVFATKKDGTALMTKTGKPYKKATLKFTETGDKLVSSMVWDGNPDPKVGDVLEGEVTSREYNGNTYYDFKQATKASKVVEMEFSIANINRKLDQVIAFLKEKYPPNGTGLTSAGTPVPDFKANTPEQSKVTEQLMDEYENEVRAEDIPSW